jgi:thermitase
MRTLVPVLFAFFITTSVFSQDFFYSNNRKYYIKKADHWVIMQMKVESLNIIDVVHDNASLKVRKTLVPQRGIFLLEKKNNITMADVHRLIEEFNVIRTLPAFYGITARGDTIQYIMNDEFIVRFAENVQEEEVHKINEKYYVEVLRRGWENEYLLRLMETSSLTTLDIANIYYEDERTIWSHPNFYLPGKPESINDPLFFDQWYLQNAGQGGGVTGVDINVIPAWDITTGSSDIIVAVIDEGVEMHEDFYQGQLVTGWDPCYRLNDICHQVNDGSPKQHNPPYLYAEPHGQAVAGVIAANHNNKGIRGVSPNVKIMPIRISGANIWQEGEAIDTAWIRGADIINLSWGWESSNPDEDPNPIYIDNIAQALERAMELGRNGKGTLVVTSAGNTYGEEVTFPGNVPGVLTVGSVNNLNGPSGCTPASDWVDVVAPGPGGTLSIVTTDRHEPNGYNTSGRYIFNFGCTSASAPQASGLAALVLSVNPGVEARVANPELQNLIKATATSYGTTNWAGYGRINAYKALKYTIENHGAVLGVGMSQVTLPLWENMTLKSDIDLASNTTLTIAANNLVTIAAHSGTVTIGGHAGGAANIITSDEPRIIAESIETVPDRFILSNNYPNPFNPSTVIEYTLRDPVNVKLEIYDILGRRVAVLVNEIQQPGRYGVTWDASYASSGTYLYRIQAGSFVETRRMILMK